MQLCTILLQLAGLLIQRWMTQRLLKNKAKDKAKNKAKKVGLGCRKQGELHRRFT